MDTDITIPLEHGARLVVPAREAAAAVIERMTRGELVPIASPRGPIISAPAIGADWNGGKYAGLSIHDNQPVHLVLLPDDHDNTTWDKAVAWAEKQGGVLPSRIDQLVLFKNLKSEFQPEYYWSSETYASVSAAAWGQGFTSGGQTCWHKDTEGRARAVRRFAI